MRKLVIHKAIKTLWVGLFIISLPYQSLGYVIYITPSRTTFYQAGAKRKHILSSNSVTDYFGQLVSVNTTRKMNTLVAAFKNKSKLSKYWITGFCDAYKPALALVIWGINLTSTVGEKYTRKELVMVQLAPYQHSVVIGLILSDAWLSKTRKNGRLGFKQSLAHGDYMWFVFSLLSRAQPTRSPSYGRPRSLLFQFSSFNQRC